MTKFVKVAVSGILAAAFVVGAPALVAAQPEKVVREGQAAVTLLGEDISAVTYWVRESDGWNVVTTVGTIYRPDSSPTNHVVMRFASHLLPGQTQQISVPSAVGEQQQMLWIRRLNDGIEVAPISPSPAL